MSRVDVVVRRGHRLMAIALMLAVGACQQQGERAAQAPREQASDARLLDASDGTDWLGYGRTYGEQHFSPLKDINDGNVSKLGLVWSLDLPPGPSATQPIAVDGVVYMSSGLSIVRAIDAVTGRELWNFDPEVGKAAGDKLRQGWGNRGIAYWNGKVYTGTIDGRLIAIDAKTGREAWSVLTTGKDDGRYITGAPRVIGGRILIGHGGADSASIRGYVTAYDAATGKQAWRFYTVPGNPALGFEDAAQEAAAKTWAGEWWKYGGGGNVWNSISYDPETDTVFLGTGNGAPWNHRVRSAGRGDNLYLSSIVALDARTGKYKWHYQVNPSESWDYNASMDMHLADVVIDGRTRKVVMQAPKNGFLYVLDRVTGELLSAEQIAKVTWASKIDLATGRPLENPAARYPDGKSFELWPSMTGAHSATPSAYSPDAGLMFIPLIEKGAVYYDGGITAADWKRTPRNAYDFAVFFSLDAKIADPLHNTSWLLAIDPATGKQAWRVRTPNVFNGGLMVTAGNLVFQGHSDGTFNAYSIQTGKVVWSFPAQTPVIGAPITFKAGGKQYVTVVAGMGSSASTVLAIGGAPGLPGYREQPRRVLTFAIGGEGQLPAVQPYRPVIPDDPDYRPDPALAKKGADIFGLHCFVCHGPAAVSGGGAPDLRMSPVLTSEEVFTSIVRDGGMVENGMPAFGEFDDETLAALRQYLRSRSDESRRQKR